MKTQNDDTARNGSASEHSVQNIVGPSAGQPFERFGLTDEEEAAEKAERAGYRIAQDAYVGIECPNCRRQRVMLLQNGKRVCEKCFWDLDARDYDGRARELFS